MGYSKWKALISPPKLAGGRSPNKVDCYKLLHHTPYNHILPLFFFASSFKLWFSDLIPLMSKRV
jgi:hypothetical protein